MVKELDMARETREIEAGFDVLLAEIRLESYSPSCLYDLDCAD